MVIILGIIFIEAWEDLYYEEIPVHHKNPDHKEHDI